MSGSRLFLNAYKVAFTKIDYSRKKDEAESAKADAVEDGESEVVTEEPEEETNRGDLEDLDYLVIDKMNTISHKTYTGNSNKIKYEDVEVNFLDLMVAFMTEHCAEYKDLNDDVIIKRPTKKKEPYRAYKFANTDKVSHSIYGVVKLGTSGIPGEIIEDLEKGKPTSKYAVSKEESYVLDYSYFMALEPGSTLGYLITQEIGSKSPISVFKKAINNYFRLQGLMVKMWIAPCFVKSKEGFMPQVTNINVEVLESPTTVTKGSKAGSVGKIARPQSFSGSMHLPYGSFSWNDFVNSSDKQGYVETKLKHFYALKDLDTSLEKKMSLTIKVNGVTRTLLVREKLEFSMGIDVTDKLKLDDDGRPIKSSFKREALDVIKFVQES